MCNPEKKQLFSKLSDMNMLLIDDDEWIRDSLQIFFDSEGCRLTTLETAEEALKLLEKNSFDIIFFDYMLPGMNGLEFLKRIQANHRSSLKIMITAYGNKSILAKAIDIGIQDFIEKPFTTHAIEQALAKLVGLCKKQQYFLKEIDRKGEKHWRSDV